jgi:hypothetical protein
MCVPSVDVAPPSAAMDILLYLDLATTNVFCVLLLYNLILNIREKSIFLVYTNISKLELANATILIFGKRFSFPAPKKTDS